MMNYFEEIQYFNSVYKNLNINIIENGEFIDIYVNEISITDTDNNDEKILASDIKRLTIIELLYINSIIPNDNGEYYLEEEYKENPADLIDLDNLGWKFLPIPYREFSYRVYTDILLLKDESILFRDWLTENTPTARITGSMIGFHSEEDVALFLLKWS